MTLGHLGLAVVVVGAAVTSYYSVERDVRMALNEPLNVGPYQFELLRLRDYQGPNYTSTQGIIRVSNPAEGFETLVRPAKRMYTVQQMPMTEVALMPGLVQEIYVAMGEPLDDGSWAVRVHYKPFVRWLWLGSLIMALGGFIAIMDPRYRTERVRRVVDARAGDADVARV
jgi:cytochrome c-type biogenesis protein CcmF